MTGGASPARLRLVTEAARLMRQRGYHGIGLAELLAAAGLPKGSLYHAFPAGKSALALAAADHAAAELLAGLAADFAASPDWEAGFGRHVARLVAEFRAGARRCPLTPLLSGCPELPEFAPRLAALYGRWIRALEYQAIRLGGDEARAGAVAQLALVLIQGGYALAEASGDPAPLIAVPARLRALRAAAG